MFHIVEQPKGWWVKTEVVGAGQDKVRQSVSTGNCMGTDKGDLGSIRKKLDFRNILNFVCLTEFILILPITYRV